MNLRRRPLPTRPTRRPARFLLALSALALLALSAAEGARAQVADAELPRIDAPVTDLADVLSPDAEERLALRLRSHFEAHGVQLALLLVPTTEGEPIEDYALRVATRWRGGSAASDQGALFVLAVRDRRMRLEVGYGLEGRITDGDASGILAGAIPSLRNQDYAGACESVVEGVAALSGDLGPPTDFEPLPDEEREGASEGGTALVVATYALLFLLASGVGRRLRHESERDNAEAIAAGIPPQASTSILARGALLVLAGGTAAGLAGLGWFHYAAVLVGLIAGFRFLWDDLFLSLHFLFMATVFSVVTTGVGTMMVGELGFGVALAIGAQFFLAILYGARRQGGHTNFSSSGVRESGPRDEAAAIAEWKRELRTSSRRAEPLSGLFGGHSTGSSSRSSRSERSGGSSWGSSSSSPSSSRSSSSSSRSSSYRGGGGGFGGGGASSSW